MLLQTLVFSLGLKVKQILLYACILLKSPTENQTHVLAKLAMNSNQNNMFSLRISNKTNLSVAVAVVVDLLRM